jgi:predicted extracellular nuclease
MKKSILVIMAMGMLIGQVDYVSDIQEDIFDNKCTSCHVYGHISGLNLTSYAGVMAGDSENGPVVIPLDHANSLIWQHVDSGFMPPGNNPDLSGDEVNLIASWIDEGALETPADDYITIAEARALAEGTIATVRGIVTTPNYQSTNTEYGLQDATAGITIFLYGEMLTMNVGDSVEVTGELDEFNGKFEIVPSGASGFTIISQNNPLPAFQVITVASLVANGEDYESELIRINGASITSGSWPTSSSVNLDISDDGGTSTVTMRIDSDMDIIGNPEPADPFNVQGIAGQYNDYQILPRYYTDFSPAGAVPPTIGSIAIEPSSPTEADDVTVSAAITDDGTIASATLTYNTGSTDTDVTMSNTTGDTYTGAIPAQAAGTTVTFSITAVDNEDGVTTSAESSYLVISTGGEITAIHDIQYTTDSSGDSPLDGQTVTISGIVTAEFWGSDDNRTSSTYDGDDHKFMAVQDAEGPWNGVVCFESGGWDTYDFSTSTGIVHSVAEGDSVTVTGTVDEFFNLTQVVDVTEVIIHGPAVNMISSTVVSPGQVMTGGTDAEAYEGCLVTVENVTVDNADLDNGEWSATDGTNSVRVDDIWGYYYFPVSAQALAEVTGVMTYTYSNAKLEPRLARDVVETGVTRIQRINQVLHSDLLKVADDNVSDMSYYMEGETVTVEGIVTVATGLAYAGSTGEKIIFEDYNGGPWSGMVCYGLAGSIGSQPIGRKIRATGVILEYGSDTYDGNVTEIDIAGHPVQVLGFDPTAVSLDTINTGDLRVASTAEQWGAVWIEINNAMVIRNDLDYGQWTIDDGSGEIKIGTNSEAEEWTDWARPPVGSFVESIRGWVYNRHGYNSDSTAYKLEPNYPSDIVFGAGPPIIAEVQRDPCVVSSSDQVQVSTMITDNSSISEAFVHFRYDGGVWDSVAMSPGTDDIWTGDIPSSSSDDVFVEYYISAYDDGVNQIEIKSSHFPNIEVGNYMGYISKNGDLTIYDIQYSPWPSGVSPYIDCSVTLTGIVTVGSLDYSTGSYNSYAMQSASAQWSGIFFDGDNLPELARGDEITMTGKVYEHYGSTNLDSVTAVTIMSTNNVISPLLVSTADLAQDSDEPESYEGCLVNVSNVTVSEINQYDWSIKDDSDISCLMDDDMATMDADNAMSELVEGQQLSYIMGIFNYSFGTYKVQIRDVADLGATVGIDDDVKVNPYEYALQDNFPNPFNPETQIWFSLGGQENVKLDIYNIMGRQVRTLVNGDSFNSGFHVLNWDGTDNAGQKVASGMYIYRIKAGDFIADKKMLLVK